MKYTVAFIGHNSIKSKIYTKLNAFIESGKCDSILFTGHSSGGTLASISAFDFQNEKQLPIEVVTFGSPKLGNASLAAEFSKRIQRCTCIVNDNDAVPLVPLLRGYHHVGKILHLRDIATSENLKDSARIDQSSLQSSTRFLTTASNLTSGQ